MGCCELCPYQNFVQCIPRTTLRANLMVVGENPSIREARTGKLFDSPGGEVIKQTLHKLGLPDGTHDTDIYFTNALNCVLPTGKNKIKLGREAITACRQRLLAEIRQVQPRVVIVLGGVALQVATGIYGAKITEYQGRVLTIDELPELKIIPCIHPATLLYNPGNYKVFSQIFTYISQVYKEDKVLDPGITEYKVVRTAEELQESYKFLVDGKYKYLGCDTETTGLNCHDKTGRILTLGLAYEVNKVLVYHESIIPLMSELLSDSRFEIIYHNAKFDIQWLQSRGIQAKASHDIMLLHYTTNETSGTHDLEQLSLLLLGAEAYKSKANAYIKSKEGFGSAPEDILFERVAVDCDNTLQLFYKLYQTVSTNPNLLKLYHQILLPASDLLVQVEMHGMLLDVPYLRHRKELYEQTIEELLNKIAEEVHLFWDPEVYKAQTESKSAPVKFNPKSPKQLAWLIFDRLRIKPTKLKKRSTDMDVLESINTPPVFIKSIIDLRHTQKELSTYVEGNLERMDEQYRVHSSFGLHITATGRLSSRGPNVQNIPSLKKDVRRAFVVPKGYKLMESDYKGAELRVLAHCSGVGALGQALIEGRDLHDDLSIRFWGEHFTKAQRMQAKTVNFGVPYGREAFSISQDFNMPVEEAQGLIDEWFKLYPEAAEYLNKCAKDAAAGIPLVTPFGRYRRFGLITPDTLHGVQNEAKNFRIQSIASDLTLISAIRIQPQILPLGAHIINLVHDSIVTEVPDDEQIIQQVATIVRKEMMDTPVRELDSKVPFGIDIEIGPNWADIKTYNIVEGGVTHVKNL